MPQIVIDNSGVTKSAIVEGAYEFCGLNGFEFERTPEEMTEGLRKLNAMLAGWKSNRGIDLGFDFPTYANGLLEEPSGIPDGAVEAVTAQLALRLAPGLGATMSPDAKAVLAQAMSDLAAAYAAVPPTMTTVSRLPSSGARHRLLTLP